MLQTTFDGYVNQNRCMIAQSWKNNPMMERLWGCGTHEIPSIAINMLADLPTGTYHARLDYLKALSVIVNHCKSLNVILIVIIIVITNTL